jgi:2-oxoglutarate dehydrogenase complex dehydrogenase (E1) component-like enzyme
MALQKNTAKAASTLARLRASQASLELRAKQLAARKMDAEGKADRLAKSLKRTIDTREKIVLGALVKMVQLDRFTLGCQNGNDMAPSRESNDNVMAQYDLDLLVGALLVLSEQLNDNDTATFDELRKRGGAFRSQAKIDRVVKLS